MRVVARALLPVSGDRIVVGGRCAWVLGFDSLKYQVLYARSYRDRADPLSLAFRGYKLMDQEAPRIWRQPGDVLVFRLEYGSGSSGHHVQQVTDKTRAAARIHLLRRLGIAAKGRGYEPGLYVAEGKRLVAEESGKSQYDPSMIRVSIDL